jgi:hypothetical protein
MNYTKTLKAFDQEISKYVRQIQDELNSITFNSEESITFVNQSDFDGKEIFNATNQKGLYLFELNLDSVKLKNANNSDKIENFANNWSTEKLSTFYASKIVDIRMKKQLSCPPDQWLPVYIGKSEDLDKRIKEHINKPPASKTYAMKLNHRTSMHGLEFRVTKIVLNIDNYDFIVPYLERVLRDKYLPIVGKQ